MKICHQCNIEYQDNFKFCPECGNKLEQKANLSPNHGINETMELDNISTEVTENERINYNVDIPNGYVYYTKDWKKIFKAPWNIPTCKIAEGTIVIGNEAFRDCTYLWLIEIPQSVTKIGDSAFEGCSALNTIDIPNSVTSIGKNAFQGCSKLHSIEIPNSVKVIGGNAFASYFNLEIKNIPNSVETIGDNAFSGCSFPESIIIPDSTTTIGEGAFSHSYFSSIFIKNNIKKIGGGVFNGCKNDISINLEHEDYFVEDCMLFSRQGHVISCWSDASEIVLPKHVHCIENGAFECCSSLQMIVIPNSVTTIGNNAFSGCSSLRSVLIPNSVTTIGNNAFSGCHSLMSMTLPNSVTKIGNGIFEYCESLMRVSVSDSIAEIGESMFAHCSFLEEVLLPKYLLKIGQNAFSYCRSLKQINMPKTIERIDSNAFFGCSLLETIDLPKSIIICNNAFSCCDSLSHVIVRNSQCEISGSEFSCCASLNRILIPIGAMGRFENIFRNTKYTNLLSEISDNVEKDIVQTKRTTSIIKTGDVIHIPNNSELLYLKFSNGNTVAYTNAVLESPNGHHADFRFFPNNLCKTIIPIKRGLCQPKIKARGTAVSLYRTADSVQEGLNLLKGRSIMVTASEVHTIKEYNSEELKNVCIYQYDLTE